MFHNGRDFVYVWSTSRQRFRKKRIPWSVDISHREQPYDTYRPDILQSVRVRVRGATAWQAYLVTIRSEINTCFNLTWHWSSVTWIGAQKVTLGNGVGVNFPSDNNPEEAGTEFGRCVTDWTGSGPHYNHVLVQGNTGVRARSRYYFNEIGLKAAVVICVFTFHVKVFDENIVNGRLKFCHISHKLSLFEFFPVVNADTPNPNTGVIEVRKHSEIPEAGTSHRGRYFQ